MSRPNSTASFYDELAPIYHLIFDDWDASIHRQGPIIAALLGSAVEVGKVLDTACGIGTQSLALSLVGFAVDGCDVSTLEITRAQEEAAKRGLNINFWVDDMRELTAAPMGHYGAVVCMDNAIPHLASDEEVLITLEAMKRRLRPGGLLVLSVRDYDEILLERPTFTAPKFVRFEGGKRAVFQVWDWLDERNYEIHLHINLKVDDEWKCFHSVGHYRAITPDELVSLAEAAGFVGVQVLRPETTGFYQPIIIARCTHNGET